MFDKRTFYGNIVTVHVRSNNIVHVKHNIYDYEHEIPLNDAINNGKIISEDRTKQYHFSLPIIEWLKNFK